MFNYNVYLLIFYIIGKTYQIANLHTRAYMFVQWAHINITFALPYLYLICTCVICTMPWCSLPVQVTYSLPYTPRFGHICTFYNEHMWAMLNMLYM